MITFDLSWTDRCFLSVIVISGMILLNRLRHAPVRAAFRQIFQKPAAVGAGIVFVFFLMIAVVDSIHMISPQTMSTTSLLDRWLAPLDTMYEQSYSKPLALELYAKELIEVDGKDKQIYPLLAYPQRVIHNHQERRAFIVATLGKTLLISLGLIVAAVGGVCLLQRRWVGLSLNKIIGVLTLFLCIWCGLCAYQLSRCLHLFGTGQIGQDIFYYAVKSIRTGLVIGILTTLFMMPLALVAGIAAGYFRGVVDDVIQYVYTTLSSIPGVLLISASVLSLQTYITNHPQYFTTLAQNADARLLALCFILGITSWTTLCRLLRAEALKIREMDYVLAAKALGTSGLRIMFKHILPNVMHIVIITLVLDFSFLVLAEAVLSYVGVGVSPLTISWGNMINAARLELAREPLVWWPMTAAFVFMFLLVLSSNLVADAVRDVLDPRAGMDSSPLK